MSNPIKDTPILTGDDAVRFEMAVHNVVPASEEERREAKEAYEYFSSIATFDL